MKTVILVRHASAERHETVSEDFSRRLRKRGKRESNDVAKRLRAMEVSADVFLSSPASRALETANVFADVLGHSRDDIVINDSLYSALSPSEFLAVLGTLDDKASSVMVFGHDPSFSDFARAFVRSFDRPMPKCGVVSATASRSSWANLAEEDGCLQYFAYPERDEKLAAKKMRRAIHARVETGLANAMKDFALDSHPRVVKELEKNASQLSRLCTKVLPEHSKRVIVEVQDR